MKHKKASIFFFGHAEGVLPARQTTGVLPARQKHQKIFLALVLLVSATVVAAAGSVKRDPDWPCQQVKVSELSVGSFWNGPAIDLTADWQHDPTVAALVGAVTQRRLPMEQAVQEIKDFAHSPAADKNQKLKLVFTGVFNVLDHERTEVLEGLDRFGLRQKTLADGLRQDGEALRAAQTDPAPDEAKITGLAQHLQWDQQVFESRRQSLSYACDVPTAIEQRLYGLAKEIEQLIE